MQLNVDVSAVKDYTNTLKRMHKSAFPVAVRGTLNSAAFDVKKNTMPKSAKQAFVNRQQNFFKANSRVEMAKGFNVSTMEASAGFVEKGLKGQRNYSVKDLVQQEFGGRIKGKAFIPMNTARTGKSNSNLVRPVNRISQLNNIVKANNINSRKARNGTNVPVKSAAEKFIIAAVKAGKGGLVLSDDIVYRVNKIISKPGGSKIGVTPLYSVKKGRSVSVKETGFMKRAANISAAKLEMFYVLEARKQFNKVR